jgi:hypothetical protein
MQKIVAVLLVAVGVLVGLSLRSAPVSAQVPSAQWSPFMMGSLLRLSVDMPEGSVRCKLIQIQGEFIGCAADEQQHPERWINLRLVKEITPSER